MKRSVMGEGDRVAVEGANLSLSFGGNSGAASAPYTTLRAVPLPRCAVED